jgi:hypothetical protein
MPNTEMLAAHHGQNRSRGCPLRSDSGITLSPFCSTDSALLYASSCDDAVLSIVMAPLPGP